MAIGKDSFKDKDAAPAPAEKKDDDEKTPNPPAEPDLPPDSASKGAPPGTVDNG